MAIRLIECQRVLKPTGSLYLHCDQTMSHYLKLLLDCIFGEKNFRNEIAWWYGGGGASQKNWAKKHDIILYYSKTDDLIFNTDAVREDYKWDKGQRRADGSARDLKKGKLPDNVFQLHGIMPWAKERTGYPTQKASGFVRADYRRVKPRGWGCFRPVLRVRDDLRGGRAVGAVLGWRGCVQKGV